MSDNYQIICTRKEVSAPDKLGSKLIKWMQSKNIIEAEKSNCLLGMEELGYKPTEEFAEKEMGEENPLRLITCGIDVKTEREVFNAMAFTAMTETICPNCSKNRFEGITPHDFFTDNLTKEQLSSYHIVFKTFDSWTRKENAELTCPHCGKITQIDDYEFDNTLSLSNFGVIIWNWPSFKPDFVEKIKEVIGTDIKVILGHL